MKIYYCEVETAEEIQDFYLLEDDYGYVKQTSGGRIQTYLSINEFKAFNNFWFQNDLIQVTEVFE